MFELIPIERSRRRRRSPGRDPQPRRRTRARARRRRSRLRRPRISLPIALLVLISAVAPERERLCATRRSSPCRYPSAERELLRHRAVLTRMRPAVAESRGQLVHPAPEHQPGRTRSTRNTPQRSRAPTKPGAGSSSLSDRAHLAGLVTATAAASQDSTWNTSTSAASQRSICRIWRWLPLISRLIRFPEYVSARISTFRRRHTLTTRCKASVLA